MKYQSRLLQTSDDVMVAGVQVMILNEKVKVVEKGDGIKGNWWEYAPEGQVPLQNVKSLMDWNKIVLK